ncbi:MAG: T9SS type A sorting domain-containing protein, partial [Fidelibacterota bacterium]
DAYALSDTGYKMVTLRDDWTLAPTVADVDGDGKDEVYVASFYTGIVYVVADADGDATTFTSSEYAAIDTLGGYGLGAAASNNAFGDPAVFVGKGSGFVKLDLTGTNVLDENSWTETVFTVDTNQTGGTNKMFAGANLDNDKFGEVVLAYQGVSDSLYAGTDSAMANPNRVFLRVLEWSGESSELAVRDIVLITPDQFKLNQNYPNPFNPSTTIEYTLPIASTISLTVYNMLGQEVVKLVNNENKPSGSYSVHWNGLDRNGVKVSSGTYFYTLKFGNFSKTKQMTFLK